MSKEEIKYNVIQIKEEVENLKKQNISMNGKNYFIENVSKFREDMISLFHCDEKIIDECLINEYRQEREAFRIKTNSQLENIYVHLCLIVYNTLTNQNEDTYNHWINEINVFYNEISKNRMNNQGKAKLFQDTYQDLLKNQKLPNLFYSKLENESKVNKYFKIINKFKISVANTVLQTANDIFENMYNAIKLNKNFVITKEDIDRLIENTATKLGI